MTGLGSHLGNSAAHSAGPDYPNAYFLKIRHSCQNSPKSNNIFIGYRLKQSPDPQLFRCLIFEQIFFILLKRCIFATRLRKNTNFSTWQTTSPLLKESVTATQSASATVTRPKQPVIQ